MRVVGVVVAMCLLVVGCAQNEIAEKRQSQWMAMYAKGKRVGYYQRVRLADGDSVVTTELTTLSMDGQSDDAGTLAFNETVETSSGKLRWFRRETSQGGHMMRVKGTVQDSIIQFVWGTQGQKQESQMPWDDQALMVDGRQQLAEQKGLKPGTEYRFQQFLTDFMSLADVLVVVGEKKEVDVLGKKMTLTETRELTTVRGNTLEYLVYRDDKANVKKVVVPTFELEMVNCSEAFAMTPPDSIPSVEN